MQKRTRLTLNIRSRVLASFMLAALFTAALGVNTAVSGARLDTSRDTLYGQVFGGSRLLADWINQARVAGLLSKPYRVEDLRRLGDRAGAGAGGRGRRRPSELAGEADGRRT